MSDFDRFLLYFAAFAAALYLWERMGKREQTTVCVTPQLTPSEFLTLEDVKKYYEGE